MAVLWPKRRFDAAIRLENSGMKLARIHHFQLRCAYRVSGFDGDLKAEPYSMACAEHSTVMLPDAVCLAAVSTLAMRQAALVTLRRISCNDIDSA